MTSKLMLFFSVNQQTTITQSIFQILKNFCFRINYNKMNKKIKFFYYFEIKLYNIYYFYFS